MYKMLKRMLLTVALSMCATVAVANEDLTLAIALESPLVNYVLDVGDSPVLLNKSGVEVAASTFNLKVLLAEATEVSESWRIISLEITQPIDSFTANLTSPFEVGWLHVA